MYIYIYIYIYIDKYIYVFIYLSINQTFSQSNLSISVSFNIRLSTYQTFCLSKATYLSILPFFFGHQTAHTRMYITFHNHNIYVKITIDCNKFCPKSESKEEKESKLRAGDNFEFKERERQFFRHRYLQRLGGKKFTTHRMGISMTVTRENNQTRRAFLLFYRCFRSELFFYSAR